MSFDVHLTDKHLCAQRPILAKAIFYFIHQAIRDGLAASISDTLIEEGKFSPFLLYKGLMKECDTRLANETIRKQAISMMMDCKLDDSTTAIAYVDKLRGVLAKLRRANCNVVNSDETMRSFLVSQVTNEDFKDVRREILKDAKARPVNECLNMLWQYELETTIMTEESPASLRARRGGTDEGDAKASKKSTPGSHGPPWNVPFIPSTWKAHVDPKMWGVILNWA